jgi:hypothetical protein
MVAQRAECCCGQLVVSANGRPEKVSVCHCDACRRRTGSAFGIAAFYPRHRLEISGNSGTFQRPSASGFDVVFHFCPSCGSNLYWEPARMPELIGVAAGAFADPAMPPPDQSVWDDHRYPWIAFPESLKRRSAP